MNIEEVIAKLIDIKSERGNIDVFWYDSEYGYFDVDNFCVHTVGVKNPKLIVEIS